MKKDRKFKYIIVLAVLVVLAAVLLNMRGRGPGTRQDPVLPADTDADPPSRPETLPSSEAETSNDSDADAKDPEAGEDAVMIGSPADQDPGRQLPAENEDKDVSEGGSDAGGQSYVPGVNDTPVIQDSDD